MIAEHRMRTILGALASCLFLASCTTMEIFDTLAVVSEAYSIKQCREQFDREEQKWAYASCESGW